MNNSRLVYSTEQGRVCPHCGHAARSCRCNKSRKKQAAPVNPVDGILRMRWEVKGRKGKGVTAISGFGLEPSELKALASRLKRLCATGGAVKEGCIVIQGDHRTTLLDELRRQGFKVKLAGG